MATPHAAPADSFDAVGHRWFWPLAGLVVLILVANGLAWDVTRPMNGLHAWGKADAAWFARNHVRYGLGYTHGLAVQAVGDPPPENPNLYVNHPQLTILLNAASMYLLGPSHVTLNIMMVVQGVVIVLLFMRIVRSLADPWTALVGGLLFALMPISVYFGMGGWLMIVAMLATWWYLILIGEISDGPAPRRRHYALLGVSLVLLPHFAWTGVFYAGTLGLHYVARCLRRLQWPNWVLLGVGFASIVVGIASVFGVLLVARGGNGEKLQDLYAWRSGNAEAAQTAAFQWGAWFLRVWEFMLSNFTWAVIALAVVGVAVVAARQVWQYLRARVEGRRVSLFTGSPQLLLFLLPGVLQLFLLKGALWPHHFWERPLAPFLALTAAVAIVALVRRIWPRQRQLAVLAGIVVLGFVAFTAVQGQGRYFRIVWQPEAKLALWQELNAEIPSDKPVLVFDPANDQLLVTQSEEKGEVMRGEPAWYLDRRIEWAPSRTTLDRTYARIYRVQTAFMETLQQAQSRGADPRTLAAVQRTAEQAAQQQLQAILQQEIPRMVQEIEALRAATGAPRYLMFAAHTYPQCPPWNMVPRSLMEQLVLRYRVDSVYKAEPPIVDEKAKETIQYGTRPYVVFDLTAPPEAAPPNAPQ